MKIPPYGKPLRCLLQSGQLPSNDVYVYIGDKAWDKGQSSAISRPSRTLVLPPDKSPLAYDWPVNGCDIIVIETSSIDRKSIDDFAFVLFNHGALKIIVIRTDMSTIYFKKDF